MYDYLYKFDGQSQDLGFVNPGKSRCKERTIRQALTLLKKWSVLTRQGIERQRANGKVMMVKLTSKSAARHIGIKKRSIDDYLMLVR